MDRTDIECLYEDIEQTQALLDHSYRLLNEVYSLWRRAQRTGQHGVLPVAPEFLGAEPVGGSQVPEAHTAQ
jgi:hypothetical protein